MSAPLYLLNFENNLDTFVIPMNLNAMYHCNFKTGQKVYWACYYFKIISTTRLHSSRCTLPAYWPYLLACTAQGGGGACSGEGVSAPGGGVCSWGVPALGECLLLGGVCSWVCLVPGGCIPVCTEGDPSCGQNSWHTLLKVLPCPKLCLRAVTSCTKMPMLPSLCIMGKL